MEIKPEAPKAQTGAGYNLVGKVTNGIKSVAGTTKGLLVGGKKKTVAKKTVAKKTVAKKSTTAKKTVAKKKTVTKKKVAKK